METETKSGLRWLSVSKIGVAQRCPLQFKFRYIDKIPEPSSGVMLSGRVVHAVLEKALRRVLGGDGLPTAMEMDDWYEIIWRESAQEEEEKDNHMGWKWDEGDPEKQVKESCRGLVRVAREEVLPKIKPAFVEHNFHLDFEHPEISSYRIYGVIDLVEQGGLISDWKTSKSVSIFSKKLDVQMMGYSWWSQQETGKDVIPARKIFLVRGKGRRSAHVEGVQYEVTQRHREWFKQVADEVWTMSQQGGFVPNTNGWWCSQKFCSFYGACQGDL